MIPTFETREELARKVEWEGGLEDTIAYGVRWTHLNPDDPELIAAWSAAEDAYKTLEHTLAAIEALLP